MDEIMLSMSRFCLGIYLQSLYSNFSTRLEFQETQMPATRNSEYLKGSSQDAS